MPDNGMAAFARWRALVVAPDPRHRLGPSVDWARVESELGLPLPADYRAYVDAYGFGWVNRLLWVAHPTTRVDHLNLGANARAQDNPDLYEMIETPPPRLLGVGSGRLMACAGTETQDVLYWDTADDDPDRWPIVFRDAEGWEWRQYDLTLTGFILALFTGEIEPADYVSAGYIDQQPTFVPDPWKNSIQV